MKFKISILLLLFFNSLFSQQFNNVNVTAGINHRFEQSQEIGGGVVFFDYDNDGWEDLYVTGGKLRDFLFKNNGDGTFTSQFDVALLNTANYYTTGAVAGDIDNDGDKDIFVTTWKGQNNTGDLQPNLLFINNNDGSFTESGASYGFTDVSFSTGVAMFDFNNDGFLDIYVVNYIETSSSEIVDGELTFDHTCYPNFLYQNNGDGTFTNISVSTQTNDSGCGLGVMPTDYDQDNDQDLYVANDFGAWVEPNVLFNNDGGAFSNNSIATNLNIGIYAMGLAYADIDKDLDFDYYITNLGRNVLIENNGSNVFNDIATTAGVENTYTIDDDRDKFTTSWGTAFLDVNNDTWPDLFVANGQIPAGSSIETGPTDPNKLFINNGDNTFNDVSISSEIDDTNRGRGMAYCDYDKDGDLDIFVVVQDQSLDPNAKSILYQNQLNPNDNPGNNWIQLDLEGVSINKDAIGAIVKVNVNGETLIQEVHGQGSHASMHSLILHFGLGSNTTVDSVEIEWSATSSETITGLAINQQHHITESSALSVDEVDINTVKVFPNPTENQITITNLKEPSLIQIYSLEGKLLKSTNTTLPNTKIDISKFTNGSYFLKIHNQKQSFNQQIVKQ